MKSIQEIFPRASASFIKVNPHITAVITLSSDKNDATGRTDTHNEATDRGSIPNSKPKRNQTPTLGSTIQGKTESLCRVKVRFIGYRVRPLDPDNFAGSCKDLLDGLHHYGLIKGDEPWRIIFETAQEKVKTYKEEKTLIEIDL